MNNLPYDKVNMMIHLQNQKSHYKRILQVKKNIDFKTINQKCVNYVGSNHKLELIKELQKKQNNRKLFNKITEINNTNGLLQLVQLQSRNKFYRTNSCNPLMFKHTDKDNSINRQYVKFVQKLIKIKPKVGNVQEWKKQWKKCKKDRKRIQKFGKNKSYDPQIYLRNTLSTLSRNNKRSIQRFSNLSRNYTYGSQSSEKIMNHHQSGRDNQHRRAKLGKKHSRKTTEYQLLVGQNGYKHSNKQQQNLKFTANQILLRNKSSLFVQKFDEISQN